MKIGLLMSGLDRGCYARRISFLLFSLLGMVWMMGCSESPNGMDERLEFGLITRSSDIEITDSCIVTLVTAKQDVSFWKVIANSDIMVDWGDGSFDMNHYAHTYTDGTTHTIKFYGSPTALTFLSCNNLEATELVVKGNLALEKLFCAVNNLTELDVSTLLNLKELACGENQLSELNVNNNIDLIAIHCMDNRLTNINVCNNNNLEIFAIFNNQIDTIDITNNRKLRSLDFCNCLIQSVNIENNSEIEVLGLADTPLAFNQEELMKLINHLPNRGGMSYGNILIDEQLISSIQDIAALKNWICYAYQP